MQTNICVDLDPNCATNSILLIPGRKLLLIIIDTICRASVV